MPSVGRNTLGVVITSGPVSEDWAGSLVLGNGAWKASGRRGEASGRRGDCTWAVASSQEARCASYSEEGMHAGIEDMAVGCSWKVMPTLAKGLRLYLYATGKSP